MSEDDRHLLSLDTSPQDADKEPALEDVSNRRRCFVAVAVAAPFAILAWCVWKPSTVSSADVSTYQAVHDGRVQLSANAECMEIPKGCHAYMHDQGCAWTKKWACPGSATSGSVGWATPDSSIGHSCCCQAALWKAGQDESSPPLCDKTAEASSRNNAQKQSGNVLQTNLTFNICTTGSAGVGSGEHCKFPFRYGRVTYNECTVEDNTVIWCYTELDVHGNGVVGKWGECSYRDDKPCDCEGTCRDYPAATPAITEDAPEDDEICTVGAAGVGGGRRCIFPFKYKGVTYTKCAVQGVTNWCYIEVDDDGNGVPGEWGECGARGKSC